MENAMRKCNATNVCPMNCPLSLTRPIKNVMLFAIIGKMNSPRHLPTYLSGGIAGVLR